MTITKIEKLYTHEKENKYIAVVNSKSYAVKQIGDAEVTVKGETVYEYYWRENGTAEITKDYELCDGCSEVIDYLVMGEAND